MRGYYYIMNADGLVQEVTDMQTWGEWYETADRRIAFDRVGAVTVSTVFLGLSHNFVVGGPPILFETMTFGCADENQVQQRYVTKEQALKGHREIVDRLARMN